MAQITNLQLQQISIVDDDFSCEYVSPDGIILCEQADDGSIEQFWDNIVDDVRKDPTWLTFDNS